MTVENRNNEGDARGLMPAGGNDRAHKGAEGHLGAFVADMDFATPNFILRSIQDRLNHPVMG